MTDGISNIKLGTGGVWLGWGGVRGAPAGWLTVGGTGALAGPRRVGWTAGAGHATPAYAPRTPLREAQPCCQLGGRGWLDSGWPLRELIPCCRLGGRGELEGWRAAAHADTLQRP